MKNIILFCIIIAVFSSCDLFNVNYDFQSEPARQEPVRRKWTFIIYMAADNDLESAAIADLNELEAVQHGDVPVSILVLLDRSSRYDMTNGNWSDTRLFEVKSDPNGLTGAIVSKRIDCLELGLTTDSETDLNTADPLVLSRLLDFAKRSYPADHYALFIWGHGTGWRSGKVPENSDEADRTGDSPNRSSPQNLSPAPLKAIAFDDTMGQYMSLPSFGKAIAGKGLSLIGFDTCHAALLEVAYQIRNDAELFVGSEGAIPSTGWDYAALFSDFYKSPELSVEDLGDAIQNQFSRQYAGLYNATISQIKLAHVNDLFYAFNVFAGTVADAITSESSRNYILDQVLHHVESYYFTSFPSDLFIDIYDFSKRISSVRADITPDITRQNFIYSTAASLETALARAIPSSWAVNGTTRKMGVNVIPLQGPAVPAAMHELAYVRGSMAMEKSAFVENSEHWVPNSVPVSGSFLDKLFYWTY